MVMSIDFKTLGGQRAGNVVVSAEVLAHAMDKYDDARPVWPASAVQR